MVFDMAKPLSVRTFDLDYLSSKKFIDDVFAAVEDYGLGLSVYASKNTERSKAHFSQEWKNLSANKKANWEDGEQGYIKNKVYSVTAHGGISTHRKATVENIKNALKPTLLAIQKEAKRELELDKSNLHKTPAFAMRHGSALRDLIDETLAKGQLGKKYDPKTKQTLYPGSAYYQSQHSDFFKGSFGDETPPIPLDMKKILGVVYSGAQTVSAYPQQGLSQDEINTVLALYETAPEIYHEQAAQILERIGLKLDYRKPGAVKLPDEIPRSAYTSGRGMDYINRLFKNHDERFGLTPSGAATNPLGGATSFGPNPFYGQPIPRQPFVPSVAVNPFTPPNNPQYKYPTPSKRIFPSVQAAQQAAKNWALYGNVNGPSYYATSGPMQTPSFPAHTPFPYGHQYSQPIGPSPQRPYNFPVNRPDLRNKDEHTIAKTLPMLVRPTINLIKSLGNMAAESAKATQAMSVLSSALGNPFEEGTLEGITQWGGSFGDMSGSFISGVGGMLGGVGEGVGRMANNAMLGDKADVNANATQPTKPGSGIGKAAGAFSAVTGIVGAYLGGVGQSISAGWNIANGLLKSINKATLKIMDTSPIFKTIKDILNLSFTMAFLPAMTLLQGKMLPIFVDLLKSAVKFGQEFAQEFLPYVPDLVKSFKDVVKHVVDFFEKNKENLAQMVAGMVALLPKMMQLQLGLIKLFVDNKEKLLEVANKTIETMKVFIDGGLLKNVLDLANVTTAFIMKYGVPMANATISLAKFFVKSAEAIAGGLDNVSTGAYQGGITGAVSKGVSFLLGAAGIHLASGGYVPATPGGVPAIIGEGGEGEYVIPESKLNSIGGLTIVFSGNVYGMNDFKQQVRSIMNEYTTKANFR